MGGQIKGKQLVTNLHLSGSLTMTGSIVISGSNPLTIVGLQNNPSPNYNLTYNDLTGIVSYGVAASTSSGSKVTGPS